MYISKKARRAIASRANGKRSKGPKTEQGKRISSVNATRHGLLSRCVVLANESQEVFTQLLTQHLQKLNPTDDIEYGLVEEMAAAMWRLRRTWAIETRLINEQIDKRADATELGRIANAFAAMANTNQLHLIDRYEARFHKMYQRALHNLILLRAMPHAEMDNAEMDGAEIDTVESEARKFLPLLNEPSTE